MNADVWLAADQPNGAVYSTGYGLAVWQWMCGVWFIQWWPWCWSIPAERYRFLWVARVQIQGYHSKPSILLLKARKRKDATVISTLYCKETFKVHPKRTILSFTCFKPVWLYFFCGKQGRYLKNVFAMQKKLQWMWPGAFKLLKWHKSTITLS